MAILARRPAVPFTHAGGGVTPASPSERERLPSDGQIFSPRRAACAGTSRTAGSPDMAGCRIIGPSDPL